MTLVVVVVVVLVTAKNSVRVVDAAARKQMLFDSESTSSMPGTQQLRAGRKLQKLKCESMSTDFLQLLHPLRPHPTACTAPNPQHTPRSCGCPPTNPPAPSPHQAP